MIDKSRFSYTEQNAISEGLRVIEPKKLKKKFGIAFKDLTDFETLCYVMCQICGWSYRRLAKFVHKNYNWVREKSLSAVKKRVRNRRDIHF